MRAYGHGAVWPLGAYWSKAREKVGVTAVEATHVIGLGARQGDVHDQCNYPQRQNRPKQPGLRHIGNASCEHNVLIFHKLISFSCFCLHWLLVVRSHFWPFIEVQNGNQREVMRKMAADLEPRIAQSGSAATEVLTTNGHQWTLIERL